MTAKHTPGPWTILNGEICGGGERLGVIYRAEAWTSGEKVTSEDQANARLIAAAPDLLEALKNMASECDCIHFSTDQDALAAIAKATGETP